MRVAFVCSGDPSGLNYLKENRESICKALMPYGWDIQKIQLQEERTLTIALEEYKNENIKEFIFFYTGHGETTSGALELKVFDGRTISINKILTLIKNHLKPEKQAIILDACFSGNYSEIKFPVGTQFFSSSNKFQSSYEFSVDDEIDNSVFSHYFCEALGELGGNITLCKIETHIRPKLEKYFECKLGQDQDPLLISIGNEPIVIADKTTLLPSPINSFTQQKENFLISVKNTTFDLSKEEFYTIASKYISNQTYLDKVEHQKSLYMMIETLYESSQKEDLASILHDLSDKIEFNESFNAWVEEHYNPDNEQLKEMVNEKKDEEHIFVEIHHKSGLEYNVSIYPRYRKGSKSPKHFLLEDISLKASQELFISQFRGLKSDIPIHLIIPEYLYLENFRLWLKRNRSLIHLANPLYLHSLERYNRDVDDYDWMIEEWEDRFVSTHKLKDSLHLLDSEEVIYIGKDKEENRLIGVCYEYRPSTTEKIYDDLDLAYISLWSHPTESEYHQKIIDNFDTIPLNRLPQMVKDCQHLSLLWDDMRMLYGLKKELTQ